MNVLLPSKTELVYAVTDLEMRSHRVTRRESCEERPNTLLCSSSLQSAKKMNNYCVGHSVGIYVDTLWILTQWAVDPAAL